MFGKRTSNPPRAVGSQLVDALVRERMPGADEDTLRLVVAVTGLLACVAYADRQYTEAEQAYVREALGRVQGLSGEAAGAICAALRAHVAEIAASNTQAYTRDLRELGDLALRREVLDVLVDLAAADDELAMAETDLLRRTASAMGLSADDYLRAQARYRDRLSLLK